jgi:hypothetical protein
LPKKGVWNSPVTNKVRGLECLKVPDTFFGQSPGQDLNLERLVRTEA